MILHIYLAFLLRNYLPCQAETYFKTISIINRDLENQSREAEKEPEMYRAGQMAVKAEGKARAKVLRLEGSEGTGREPWYMECGKCRETS